MRCYFLRGKRIEGVTFLRRAPDEDLIRQAEVRFHEHARYDYDGFEVWDGDRFIYRIPADRHEATNTPS
jgi:hypothetical protein